MDGTSYAMAIWGTRYGDGGYPVIDQEELVGVAGVDAGCLAIIPMELVNEYQEAYVSGDGVVVSIVGEFTPRFEEGDGFFGNISVITSGLFTDEEEEEEPDPFENATDDVEEEFFSRYREN